MNWFEEKDVCCHKALMMDPRNADQPINHMKTIGP